MDIQLFRTFLTVAKLGNMTQAAEIINFTQPTVTSQIRALEEHFGVMLFERVGKKLYITESGKQLIRYSETILSAYQEACETLNITTGNANLGASTAMVNYLLIPIFEEFQQEFCHNSVSIEMCANTAAVVRGVLENRFDLGFIHNAVAETQLVQSEIYQEN